MNECAHAFSSTPLFWRWISLSGLLVALDQASKISVAFILPLHSQIEVTPFFNFVHTMNPGAAFCFLADAGSQQTDVWSIGKGCLISTFGDC